MTREELIHYLRSRKGRRRKASDPSTASIDADVLKLAADMLQDCEGCAYCYRLAQERKAVAHVVGDGRNLAE